MIVESAALKRPDESNEFSVAEALSFVPTVSDSLTDCAIHFLAPGKPPLPVLFRA